MHIYKSKENCKMHLHVIEIQKYILMNVLTKLHSLCEANHCFSKNL